jgi:hypothetical protein
MITGAAAPALRRAGGRDEKPRAPARPSRARHGSPQALARGGHPAQRRGQRALPAGRSSPPTCGRCTWARARTNTATGRVLPPHLPDRKPSKAAGRPVRRLSGQGGDPVIQLQTNFGGGKTTPCWPSTTCFSGSPPPSWPGWRRCCAPA